VEQFDPHAVAFEIQHLQVEVRQFEQPVGLFAAHVELVDRRESELIAVEAS
jgi:hypothetical protein